MSTKKPASDEVFDLDAVAAESQGTAFRFKLGGEEFTLPAAGDVDWRQAQLLESGKIDAALMGMMGEEQYHRFYRHDLTVAAMSKLMERYMAHQGVKPGELGASSGS